MPSLGPLNMGHLLIVSKSHYTSMSQLPAELYKDFDAVYAKVRSLLIQEFGTAVSFEHGSVSRINAAGSCIDHAHTHMLPLDASIRSELAQRFDERPLRSSTDLVDQSAEFDDYIFLHEGNLRFVYKTDSAVPSQLVRQLIAVRLGRTNRWDWRQYPEPDQVLAMLDFFAQKF